MAKDPNEMDEMEKFLAEDMELEELEELEEKKKREHEKAAEQTQKEPQSVQGVPRTPPDETLAEPVAQVAPPMPEDVTEVKPQEEELFPEAEVPAPVQPTVTEDDPLNQTLFALRTTANREDQVMDFVTSNVEKHKYKVRSVIRPHGMRGYIFVEAAGKLDAEQAAANIPYARGILPTPIKYKEIEHMLEQVKKEIDIRKNDIAEIISGPFKREQAKITRVDKLKEEVVVELLGAAVPIPITVKMDALKVIRRDSGESSEESA